jgi:hypothetical protein
VEDLAGATPAREEVDLVGDASAGRVDQIDHRYAGLNGALDDADDLFDRAGAPGARLDRRVVRHQADLAAVDPGDPGDHTIGGQSVGQAVGIEPVLDEGALVDQQRDPFAGEELALRGVGGVIALGAAGQHPLADLRKRLVVDHGRPPRAVSLRPRTS